MRRSIISMAALGLLLALFVVPFSSARIVQAAVIGAASQDPKAEEAAAYKAWYDANAAKDFVKALELAKEYLAKYPNGQNSEYIKNKWIPQIRAYFFNEALKAKNTGEMIRLAKETLAADPENLDYIYLIAVSLRANELFASPPNYRHAAEAADFSQRAIRLIEAGKVPTVVPADKWNKDSALAALYQAVAMIEAKNGNIDKALENYKKSSALAPTDASLTAYNYLTCGSLHQQKYDAASTKYNSFPQADRDDIDNKPEVKAALDVVNQQADMVIECWARFLASPDSAKYGQTRDKVQQVLTGLYNYRHPNSPDGLQKLIEQYRSGAAPAASTSTKP